jgi:hypothetical protein
MMRHATIPKIHSTMMIIPEASVNDGFTAKYESVISYTHLLLCTINVYTLP